MAFDGNDITQEWSKDKLIPIGKFDICHGLTEENLSHLQGILKLMTFQPGETIINKGDDADNLFFLADGEVNVSVNLPNGSVKTLATLSSGMVFGEMAIIEQSTRSADVRANTRSSCYTLAVAEFDKLSTTNAKIKITLLINFARILSKRLREANQKIIALEQ
ncbi:MAG: Crp/Fnr family transcriptional regulator [Candidatus Anammoxibacter sp.]